MSITTLLYRRSDPLSSSGSFHIYGQAIPRLEKSRRDPERIDQLPHPRTTSAAPALRARTFKSKITLSLARSSVTKPDQGTAVRNPFESDENNYDEDLTGQRLRRSPCKKHSAPYRYTRKDSHRQDTDVSPTHASLFSVSIRTNLCVRSRTIVVWMASHTINARLPHRSVPDFVIRIARSFPFF